jgi:hypothetical protein
MDGIPHLIKPRQYSIPNQTPNMKTIALSNGNSLTVEIDNRKSANQVMAEEFDPSGNLLLTTTFTLVNGYRQADSRRDFEAMSEDAVAALNNLNEGRFVLP